MEHLVVTLSEGARASLRELAEQESTSEAELSSRLLVDALERLERRRWIERAVRAATPERNERDVRMLQALDRWSGTVRSTRSRQR